MQSDQSQEFKASSDRHKDSDVTIGSHSKSSMETSYGTFYAAAHLDSCKEVFLFH